MSEEVKKSAQPMFPFMDRVNRIFRDHEREMADIRCIVNTYLGADVDPEGELDQYLRKNALITGSADNMAHEDKWDMFISHVGGAEKALDVFRDMFSPTNWKFEQEEMVLECAWEIIKDKCPQLDKTTFDGWDVRTIKRNLELVTNIRADDK